MVKTSSLLMLYPKDSLCHKLIQVDIISPPNPSGDFMIITYVTVTVKSWKPGTIHITIVMYYLHYIYHIIVLLISLIARQHPKAINVPIIL